MQVHHRNLRRLLLLMHPGINALVYLEMIAYFGTLPAIETETFFTPNNKQHEIIHSNDRHAIEDAGVNRFNVFAQTTFSQGLLYSGFENAVPPAPPPGWAVSHTGNANWQSLKNFMGSGNALKGQKCMYLANSSYRDQSDAWLYTPKMHFESGKKYSIAFTTRTR